MHEHAEAADRARAPGAGRGEQRRLERVVHEVDDDLAAPERLGRDGQCRGRRRPCRPGSRSRRCRRAAAASTRSSHAIAVPPRQAAAASPRRSARRAATDDPGARTAERASDRAGRAAAAEHEHRHARPDRCSASRSERRKPAPSVESPASRPSATHVTVLTLRSAAASGESSSHSAGDRGLVRHRDRQADEAERRATASSAAARRRRGLRTRRSTQSRPSARYAALCSTGDSECRTGSPITPATASRR